VTFFARRPLRRAKIGAGGFERTPLTLSETPILETPGATSGAPDAPNTPLDPDLAQIVDCWPTLPEHIKAAMKALIDAHQASGKQVR
jgi:hypothetical protein